MWKVFILSQLFGGGIQLRLDEDLALVEEMDKLALVEALDISSCIVREEEP